MSQLELRKRLLDLLKEDEELRYAVAGLLGLEDLRASAKRLEEALAKLARGQAKSEKRLSEVEARVGRLEEAIAKLAEAQAKSEERLAALEARTGKLEDAVARLEIAVAKLAEGLDALRVEVGRLSETVGFGLEDIARVDLPGWLHRHLGVEVGELRREFLKVRGEEVEVNLYGEGSLNGERVVVLGEVKSKISDSDVERFYRRVYKPASEALTCRTIGVLFGYLIYPSAKERARSLGLHTVASYER
ncbi:hypothetical protein [Infirmifilum sp. SLHALR2]|nr:MAG: hypothetical protein B7L53_01220 [Thermofilum sp. NZ13]